jgi:tetratricopeptide (TPR) repeat protein
VGESGTVQALEPGTIIDGRYWIVRELGHGGMGSVYAVTDEGGDASLALKLLGGRHGDDGRVSTRLRFRREFHTLASLRHPRIVAAEDYGESAHGPYYTMELLGGRDLRDRVADDGVLDVPSACRILRDVAAALAFLHARQLVHRDVAPRNIRSSADGRAKLIDFGILATAGSSGEVAGTVTFIAPENARQLPLDGRADLYSLGVLGYWLVTGVYPYSVNDVDQLETAWATAPAPPSMHGADIPPAYDELIMALLCLDPLGRPRSAIEVIDRLGAIGGLAPGVDLDAPRGYLASATMVGRDHEMRRMTRLIERAKQNEGASAVIEAPSGAGKSRLLREVRLQAQLRGFTVVAADGESAGRGPYGLLRQLVDGLLDSMREVALSQLGERAGLLSTVIPELAPDQTESQVRALGDPAEQRMRIQSDLGDWLSELADRRPLALLIDDVQRCDEASAAVLAALARRASSRRLFLGFGLRQGEAIRAPLPVASLRGSSHSVALHGLTLEEIEAFVRSSFGPVRHTGRLAQWLHETTDGSPLHCTELLRRLVDDQVVRFAEGMWIIPSEIADREAPAELAGAMEARIDGLTDTARLVGEALSVHGGELSLEMCMALVDARESEVFAALDELVGEGVLIGDRAHVRFRHDGLREALLRGLPAARRQALHLRVGEVLEASEGFSVDREAETGWHLYRGGARERGGPLLERAGRRLFAAQAFTDCIGPLEAALEIHEQLGTPQALTLDLSFMLVSAGFTSDRAVGLRHAEPTMQAYREHSGLALAERLGRYLGRHLAFIVAILWTSIRWRLRAADRRGPEPVKAISTFSMGLGYACGLANASGDLVGLHRLVNQVEPLAVFPGRLPYAAYLGIRAFPDLLAGWFGPAREKLGEAMRIMETDRLTPANELERRAGKAGLHGLRALLEVSDHTPQLAVDLAAMKASRLRYYDLAVKTTEITALRLRGEEHKARQLEDDIETEVVQLGSWSIDVQILLFASPAYSVCRDILGLKRCIDAFERRIEEGYRFEERLQVTRGEYLRERGEYAASAAVLEALLEHLDTLEPTHIVMVEYGSIALAETYLAQGRFDEARTSARRGLELADHPDSAQAVPRLRALRCLGLIEAAAGNETEALAYLERAIAEGDAMECPSVTGAMHEARARVALMLGDTGAYRTHTRKAERWFRSTDNPVLIAVAERLVEAGIAHDGTGRRASTIAADAVTVASNTTVDSSRSWSELRPKEGAAAPVE